MKKMLTNLFSENSAVSMVRVMSFMCCITGCYIAIKSGDALVVSALLGTAFGGKVAQKIIEVKNG